MKKILVLFTLVTLLSYFASCRPVAGLPDAIEKEFTRFNDPHEILITSQFEKMLRELPPKQIEEVKLRLRTKLKSDTLEIRRRAALVLDSLGDAAGVPVMIKDMQTVIEQRDRDNIVVALRVMKDRRAIPILTKSVDDTSPYIRGIALAALGEMKAVEAYQTILNHLHDYETKGDSCIPMYPASSACYALGALGDKRAIPHLMEALNHKETQAAACQALDRLTGEKFHYDVVKWKKWWEKGKPNKSLNRTW